MAVPTLKSGNLTLEESALPTTYLKGSDWGARLRLYQGQYIPTATTAKGSQIALMKLRAGSHLLSQSTVYFAASATSMTISIGIIPVAGTTNAADPYDVDMFLAATAVSAASLVELEAVAGYNKTFTTDCYIIAVVAVTDMATSNNTAAIKFEFLVAYE